MLFFSGGLDTGGIYDQPFYKGLILQTPHSVRAQGTHYTKPRPGSTKTQIKEAPPGGDGCYHVPKSLSWGDTTAVQAWAARGAEITSYPAQNLF